MPRLADTAAILSQNQLHYWWCGLLKVSFQLDKSIPSFFTVNMQKIPCLLSVLCELSYEFYIFLEGA